MLTAGGCMGLARDKEGNAMELREKVFEAMKSRLDRDEDAGGLCNADRCADDILAIPEIADALIVHKVWLASQMLDLPPERVGEILRGLAEQPPEPAS